MTIAPQDNQLHLFSMAPSKRIVKNAEARNLYGSLAQEIVCHTLGLIPIRINGNFDVCPDAVLHNTYYEIKSVRKNGKVVVYVWRLKKELECEKQYIYAILIHNVRRSNGVNILSDFIKGGLTLYLVPLSRIESLANDLPIHHIKKITKTNSRIGYNRKGYIEGYVNIPIHSLRPYVTSSHLQQTFYSNEVFNVEVCHCG
jgi:hypothetical protein